MKAKLVDRIEEKASFLGEFGDHVVELIESYRMFTDIVADLETDNADLVQRIDEMDEILEGNLDEAVELQERIDALELQVEDLNDEITDRLEGIDVLETDADQNESEEDD